MQRIKGPIIKFHKNEEIFDQVQYASIKQEYLTLIKEIDAYREGKFNEWVSKIIDKAMGFLKMKILEKDENGFYRVNFKEDFKVLIKETKQLDKMNHHIPRTIINIALQET